MAIRLKKRREKRRFLPYIIFFAVLIAIFVLVYFFLTSERVKIYDAAIEDVVINESTDLVPDMVVPYNGTINHYEKLSFSVLNKKYSQALECDLKLEILDESDIVLNSTFKTIQLEPRESAQMDFLFYFPEGNSSLNLQPECRKII